MEPDGGGVQVRLFACGERDWGEQEVPDRWLQLFDP